MKTEIEILESIRARAAGPIGIGSSASEVMAFFGEPEAKSSSSRKRKPDLWKYVDVEIHFDHDANFCIWLIKFCLYPAQGRLEGWGNLLISSGPVVPGMAIDEFTSLPEAAGLKAVEVDYPFGEMRLFRVGSTEIYFEARGSDFGLHSIFLL